MKPWRSKIAVLTLAGVSALGGIAGYHLIEDVQFARAEERVQTGKEQLAKAEDLSTVFRNVGEVVEPSVVNIEVHKTIKGVHRQMPFDDDMLRKFFRDQGQGQGQAQPDTPQGAPSFPGAPDDNNDDDAVETGTGSGVIMEAAGGKGYILTNNHVAGGAEEMTITLSDGRKFTKAHVLGTDPKTDLAVVELDADHLIAASWGDSDQLVRGDWIMAFGSPFGYIGSMTHGIVSATNRTDVGILNPQQGYENFIQVDAPINPGNSGGPLVNVHGEVVGINTAIASRTGSFAGIGFAIPSNQAKFVYTALKEKGKVTRGWLGVGIKDVSSELDMVKNSFNYDKTTGVLVEQTFENTPASGKLQVGDIITGLNGKDVQSVAQLRSQIAALPPNTDIKVHVFRDGKMQDLGLKLGEQPDNLAEVGRGRGMGSKPDGQASTATEALGMRLSDATDDVVTKFNLGDVAKSGAVIIDVKPRSIAAKAGLRPGDVITMIGNQKMTSAAQAVDTIAKADLSKGVRLYITNREGSRFAFIKQGE